MNERQTQATNTEATTQPGAGPKAGRLRAARAGARVGYVNASTLADEVLDRESNPVTAWQILSFIGMWGVFVEINGREPRSLRDMAAQVGQSYATLSRWQTKFRRAFPEYESPAVLWSRVREQLAEAGPIETPESVALRIGGATL